MSTLDIDTVQAFLLVAELQGFTRAAEALGTTQAAVSMKLQRLESVVGKRLVERSPRAVALTAAGAAFLPHARALIEAHDRALSGETPARQQLSLGISDHAAGPELVPLLERLKFLCISSNNLDEFFEIRVAGLKQRLELGSNQPGADGLSITEQLQAIHDRTRSLVDIGPAEGLPRLASSKVMLHSKVSDPAKLMALRTLAATFRSVVGSAKRSVSPA